MTDPIDYSRPVGWWCPVCPLLVTGVVNRHLVDRAVAAHPCTMIPVYLPIPEGQRPPAASEVEEAEVVVNGGDGWVTVPGHNAGSAQQAGPLAVEANPVYWINYIVTGATE